MIIILSITGVILAGLTYLLCAPVYMEIQYDIEKRAIEGGLIKLYPFMYRIRPKSGREKAAADDGDQGEQKKVRERRFRINYLQLITDDMGMLRQVVCNAVRLIRRVVISPNYRLNAHLTGGFSEPHVTGCFYGGVCAIQPMLGQSIDISYAPDLAEDSLYGKVTGSLDVRLYGIIKETLIFIWRLPKWRLFQIYLESRKGRAHGE